ncbi:uncharacterized protein [Pseudorasbora parva]|uniref:uncharacterized protein n=1 Tax=Pseudorasbora parva TaxID=51549 RepID=UPI00351F6B26
MDAALAPLRLKGMRVLNYLDDWLVIARLTRAQLLTHKSWLLNHLDCLGLRINIAKSSLSPTQKISFLGIILDSRLMNARLTTQRALSIQNMAASFNSCSPETFSEDARPYGLGIVSAQTGTVTHVSPPALATRPCPSLRVEMGPSSRQSEPQRCQSFGSLDGDRVVSEGVLMGTVTKLKVVSTDASTQGWGALHEGKPISGLWTETEKRLHINCLEMKAVALSLRAFLPHIKNHHVLVRTDNMSVVAYINRQGGLRSHSLHRMAKHLLLWAELPEGGSRARYSESGSGYVIQGTHCPRGMVSSPANGSLNLEHLRQKVDLFASEDNTHCPIFFSKRRDAVAHVWPSLPLYAFPPIAMLPQTIKKIRETASTVLLIAPLWRNRTWFSDLIQLSDTAPWPIPLRKDLLTQAKGEDLASQSRTMGPPHMAHQLVSGNLSDRVMNTIAEARAPATRRLYTLKWSVYSN